MLEGLHFLSTRALAWTIVSALLAAPGAASEPVGELLTPFAARFHASDQARADQQPSFSLVRPFEAIGPADGFDIEVRFTTDAGRFIAEIETDPGTSLYGTGQAAGPLLRNGRRTEQWNTDAYNYQDESPLYTSHPWVLAVRADGSSFGVLADTTYRSFIDLTDGIRFESEGPAHPVIVIKGATPQDVVRGLATLTGTIEMPPKWAIGYHQCRYSYYPDEQVREIALGFRERNLPCDVIWMDIDYMDGFRCFTFDPSGFPDPAGLNKWLDDHGFANVWMINPGIKNEDGYFVHDQGDAIKAWVTNPDGSEYRGNVWPGEVVFPDYTRRDVRAWWAGLYADFMALGIDGVWNDMNEPTTFIRDENNEIAEATTFPLDTVHDADEALGGRDTHARYHNVYGMLMVMASREGIMAANPEKRPFVLSRANFMGGHRYGATWTGDNTSNWFHVDTSIPMVLNLGLSAQPFAGPDIGGFIDNTPPEMFARWMGFGALLPFARGHTQQGNEMKEPWAYGPEVEATSRRALERRYRLLPLFYTLFEEASRTGLPVARPLFFRDPTDPSLRAEDDAFMLGTDLLVAVQTSPERVHAHALPKNAGGLPWRGFDFPDFDGDGRDSDDPHQPTLYARPGGIIPTGPVIQHVEERPNQRDRLTLIVYLDHEGRATGELYEDAGWGWGFKDGEYLRTRYTAERSGDRVIVRGTTIGGNMDRPDRELIVRLLLPDGEEISASGRDGVEIGLDVGLGAVP
ncbi:MAG: TIM-barrel domain-containing protein [Phycisphaerales bacterium]